MTTSRVPRALSAVLLALLCAGAADAQSDQIVVGLVRGDEPFPPKHWRVSIVAKDGPRTLSEHSAEDDLYVVFRPGARPARSLIFSAHDYQLLEQPLPPTRGQVQRIDVQLKRSEIAFLRRGEEPTRGEVERFRQHLRDQAEIAERGGREARAVYHWNFEGYEADAAEGTQLHEALEAAKAQPEHQQIRRDFAPDDMRGIRDIRRFQHTPGAPVDHDNLLRLLGDERQLPWIRAEAVAVLGSSHTPAAFRRQTRDLVRAGVEHETDVTLRGAYATALLELAPTEGRNFLIGEVASPDLARAQIAAEVLARARLTEDIRVLGAAVAASPHPTIRARLLREYAARDARGAGRVALDRVGSDESALVRLEAVRVLRESPLAEAEQVEVGRTLRRVLAAEPDLEVLAEVHQVLRRP